MILSLDDEPLIGILIEDAVAEQGGKAVSVVSCAEALQWLDSVHFDAAVLDVRIGNGDCKAVADKCREMNIPFVISTGDPDGPTFGAGERVVKPFYTEDLVAAFLRVLPGRGNNVVPLKPTPGSESLAELLNAASP
jgi:DNA-binding response OmpR family regulator